MIFWLCVWFFEKITVTLLLTALISSLISQCGSEKKGGKGRKDSSDSSSMEKSVKKKKKGGKGKNGASKGKKPKKVPTLDEEEEGEESKLVERPSRKQPSRKVIPPNKMPRGGQCPTQPQGHVSNGRNARNPPQQQQQGYRPPPVHERPRHPGYEAPIDPTEDTNTVRQVERFRDAQNFVNF